MTIYKMLKQAGLDLETFKGPLVCTTIREYFDENCDNQEEIYQTKVKNNGGESLLKDNPHITMEFNNGFGCPEAPSIILWAENWVYFICTYDGSEWIERIPALPCSIDVYKHKHIGGW